jgi:hypothetical protein
MNWVEKIGAGFAVLVVAFFLYLVLVLFPVLLWAEAKCLRYGWSETRVTVGLQCYCVREEGAYDIVRPLSDIIAESTGQ